VVTVVYTVIKDHSVVGGAVRELKILMFATNGEKDILKDNVQIFNLIIVKF
tara:strand:- start:444 stop:596 length:153 start_codon:yes stop_codon:yes gene_type:complete